MDEFKLGLKGSESRDVFKLLHKLKFGGGFYASDLDLCLVSKNPPCVIAFLDYKRPDDRISFAEGILYNELKKIAPVYVIIAELIEGEILGPFTIKRISNVNWKPEPPEVMYRKGYSPFDSTQTIDELICQNWEELKKWELDLRSRRQKEEKIKNANV